MLANKMANIDVDNCDLKTLFILRFMLDRVQDISDLNADIHDLQSFPERLESSYIAEWRAYVKRELHQLKNASSQRQTKLLERLESVGNGKDAEFEQLQNFINTALKVNNCASVTVMTTPLKSYVNYLLQL
jgi:hypothetical protein